MAVSGFPHKFCDTDHDNEIVLLSLAAVQMAAEFCLVEHKILTFYEDFNFKLRSGSFVHSVIFCLFILPSALMHFINTRSASFSQVYVTI